jgi:glycerophosphoryl diester phosphodiesterase
MIAKALFRILVVTVLTVLALGATRADAKRPTPPATIEMLLDLQVRPFAIAHHGFGDNNGEDPTRPIENTVPAVREGYLAGASVVEVDVQLTRDGEVAVYHDDFLADLTCLNALTMVQLQARVPYIPSLEAILNQARKFNSTEPLSGLLLVELKPLSPLCDPNDTQERAIVSAVVGAVRRMGMTSQVMFTSFSPALILLASEEAPEIARDLSVSGLQFLTAEEVEAALDLPVTPINKKLSVGLQWAEIGHVFRLPHYDSVNQLLATAATTRVRVVEGDLLMWQLAGAPLANAAHAFGLKVLGFTATKPAEWFFLQSLGLDGIYADDVPFGVAHEAPIP